LPPTPRPPPVTGTLIGQSGTVAGTFDVQEFVVEGDAMHAVDTFTGTVTEGN
jgi:hypothetical protein